MKIGIVRGKYLNNYEMQSFAPIAKMKGFDLTAFASKQPISNQVGFSVRHLWSPLDLPDFPYKLPILNRVMVDAMYLLGLEQALAGYDIAHVRETYFHFTQQALTAKKQNQVQAVICTCSETIPFNHEGIRGRRRFKQRAIREVDLFHVLTSKARDCLITEGCRPDKIRMVRLGIDTDRFCPLPTQSNSDTVKLLFVGRLVEEKGVKELVEAFFQLTKKASKPLELTMIGRGPLREYIATKTKQYRLGQQLKLITADYSQIHRHYQTADIFVLPSKPTLHWEEYYGMAVLEAMSSGLPIVTTDCGALAEVVKAAGLIIQPDTVKPLIKTITQLIDQTKLRQELGNKARQRALTKFSIRKQAPKLAKLYLAVLNQQ